MRPSTCHCICPICGHCHSDSLQPRYLALIPPTTVHFFLKLLQSTIPAKPSTTTPAPATPQALADVPDTTAAAIVSLLASGRSIYDLDLSDPSITAALAAIVTNSSPVATPDAHLATPNRRLFDTKPCPVATTSPSIRRHLTNADRSADPTFCGALDFLDSQPLFDAIFPHLDRKPIGSLHSFDTPSAIPSLHNAAELSIQAFLSDCRLQMFRTVIRLDYIGRHDFASADHL